MRRFLLIVTFASGLAGTAMAAEGAPSKYALLVGCTQYPNCDRVRPLRGPQNDVPLLARVLKDRFGFKEKNIIRLVGWPNEPEHRPTHKNITAAFETLIQKAAPDTQIVILLSGHGTQVPIPEDQKNPLDSKNPESDGLDEVFLPADVSSWSGKELGNAIRDDQIGGWLDAMRAKGAAVWILFDCCHSGTMTRGDEVSRAAPQEDLGIPPEVLKKARDAARRAGQEQLPLKDAAPVDLHSDSSGKGSVTAFYAAQPFEEAPELPRPAGAERVPENYYGLMTYVVAQALLEQPAERPLTYRDLSQFVLSRYRAERGSRGPTPLFDIRDNREVLGLKAGKWPPQTELTYEKGGGELRIVGGTLRGLTPGSLLKLMPAMGRSKEGKPLAFVRVKSATAAAAIAEPCEHDGMTAAAIDDLPAIGRCEIVSRDLGDMRVKVRTRPSEDTSLREKNAILEEVLKSLPPAAQELTARTKEEEPDSWVLWLASPAEAREFGFELSEARVLLVHSEVFSDCGAKSRSGDLTPMTRVRTGRASARYATASAKEIAAQLENDLRRIFTWQCLWRLTGQMAGQKAEKPPVTLEVAAVKSADDPTSGELLRTGTLHPGQFLEVRVGNPTDENQWVTVLFLGADLSIEVFATDSVPSEKALKPFRIELNDSSLGNEGLVVLSLPMSEYRQKPDLHFLEQEALGAGSRKIRPQAAKLETPFGRLMRAALEGRTTRGPAADAPDNADFASWTWTTIPRTAKP